MYYKFERRHDKKRKWLYVNYEEILKNLIRIYAEQEGIKVEINIDRRWLQMKKIKMFLLGTSYLWLPILGSYILEIIFNIIL